MELNIKEELFSTAEWFLNECLLDIKWQTDS